MASLTAEVQQLITRDRLGSPLKIFGPHTVLSIIGGLFLIAFAVLWTLAGPGQAGKAAAPPARLEQRHDPVAGVDPVVPGGLAPE